MPVYNTLVPVVACVDATDEKAAIARLTDALTAAGFEVYEDGEPAPHAFESEDGVEAAEFPARIAGHRIMRNRRPYPGENPYW